MLLVETRLGRSEIEGIGLFANRFISQGTPIWRFTPGFDIDAREKRLKKLSPPAKEQFLKYAYREPGTDNWVLCFDDARFFNHSPNPNCINVVLGNEEWTVVAGRDIKEGEELTCDYRDFDADADSKLKV